jgi:hypothetical protein
MSMYSRVAQRDGLEAWQMRDSKTRGYAPVMNNTKTMDFGSMGSLFRVLILISQVANNQAERTRVPSR